MANHRNKGHLYNIFRLMNFLLTRNEYRRALSKSKPTITGLPWAKAWFISSPIPSYILSKTANQITVRITMSFSLCYRINSMRPSLSLLLNSHPQQ